MKLGLIIGWLGLLGGMFLGAHHTKSEIALPVLNANDVQLKSRKGVWHNNGLPFTGVLLNLSANGDTLGISNYVNGLEHGLWKTYYSRTKPRSERTFDHGKKSGPLIQWYENGQIQVKANFIDDEYEGALLEWDADGQLLKSLTYSHGHESGAQRAWNANGRIRSNYVVIDGRRYGLLGTNHCVNVSDSTAHTL